MSRRGSAAMLALVFMVLFLAMSYGLFAIVSTSVGVAGNDRDSQRARAAAESGLDYLKHILSQTKISSSVPDSEHLQMHLQTLENASGQWACSLENGVIRIPAAGDIALQSGSQRFTATIEEDRQGTPTMLRVRIVGIDGMSGLTRQITCMFSPRDLGTKVFSYTMATPGGINITGGSIDTDRGIMSSLTTSPAIRLSNATLEGSLGVTQSPSQVIGGADYDVKLVFPPTYPEFDTTPFKRFATTPYSNTLGSVWTNVHYSSANGKKLIVSGGTTIRGILYVDPGVELVLNGSVTLNGIIVCEQNPGSITSLQMSGNFSSTHSTEGLDPELVELSKGFSILAPTANISLAGSSGLVTEGSVICNKFDGSSNTGGSSDDGKAIRINNGTILAMYDQPMTSDGTGAAVYVSNRTITFTSDSNYQQPTVGMVYKKQYVLVANSYLED